VAEYQNGGAFSFAYVGTAASSAPAVKTAAERTADFCRRDDCSKANNLGPKKLTVPHAPHLSEAGCRFRHVESTEEREAREMAAIPKFKARPVNRKMLESAGELGVPTVAKKAVTEAKAPTFQSDARLKRYHQAQPAAAEQKKAPRKVHYTGETTVPVSPHLSKSTRHRNPVVAAADEAPQKARPAWTGELVEPKPFMLQSDIRGAQKQAELEARIRRAREKEMAAHGVHAAGVSMAVEHVSVPVQPEPVKLTSPKPFKLHGELLHEVEQSRLERLKREEAEEQAAARRFKAQPAPKSLVHASIPAKPEPAPLTEPREFHLHVVSRAEARAEFDEQHRVKTEAVEIAKVIAAEEAAAVEAAELKDRRANELVFKAKPVNHRRPLQMMPSNVPLTTPESPSFGFDRLV
jgi:targeting protein for Xklp2